MGNRVIAPLALARSLDSEHDGALPAALAALTAGFSDGMEELEEVEDLLADAVRLAISTGDLGTARDLTGHAAALAADSQIPHRQANALYCRGLLDHDACGLAEAAERFGEAAARCCTRRRWRRPPSTSSAPTTATGPTPALASQKSFRNPRSAEGGHRG